MTVPAPVMACRMASRSNRTALSSYTGGEKRRGPARHAGLARQVLLGAPKRCTITSAAGLSLSFRRHQVRPVSQYLLETLGETHEGCAIDDVVIDAEVQMDDVAFDRLPVVENQLFLDGADRQPRCQRGDRDADRGA